MILAFESREHLFHMMRWGMRRNTRPNGVTQSISGTSPLVLRG
jgi:hypothetical protein